MPTNSINLTIHETYDLNTKVDAVTLLAIRTPSRKTVERYVSCSNWSKIKFNRASLRLACVSQLPVDPLGVGFEAGKIAPQELVNPMLFKTVTGESLGPILDVIYGPNASKDGGSLREIETNNIAGTSTTNVVKPLDMYYTLLGDDSFRQVHPQSGLVANGLIPLVREMYVTMPLADSGNLRVGVEGWSNANNPLSGPSFVDGLIGAEQGTGNTVAIPSRIISGPTRPMPAIDTISTSKQVTNVSTTWPMSYCAVCIMPPAIQKSLYYRCIVSWNITLSGFIPTFRLNSILGTDTTDLYADWTDRPVDSNTALANELWDEEGLIATDGVENVTMITQNLT